jgi:hypothetical protein
MSEIKFTELDFAKIKDNLKNYLKSQSKFKDYNFDGSGFSVLLDVLAYNTAYNGFYLNMLASEMFLDSAYMRESVVSLAKQLGYTPSSRRALSAYVDLEIDFSANNGQYASKNPNTSFLIPTDDSFHCMINQARFTFYPKVPVLAVPVSATKYVAKNIQLVQGKRLTYRWTVDSTTKQQFIIPNANIDISTLSVYVSDSVSSTTKTRFDEFKDLTLLGPKDEIYFIQEVSGSKFEIVFGDGILGKKLSQGNVIDIEYIVPGTDEALGASTFYVTESNIGPYSPKEKNKIIPKEIVKVKTAIGARDFAEKETTDTIKYRAPRMYDAQNRAVTKNDYEILLKKDMSIIEPKIEYLRVWGGEENTPPEYGKVFFAIKPVYGLKLNEQEKLRIVEEYIRPKNMVSVEVEVVEPDYIGLIVDCTVNYFGKNTKVSESVLKDSVIQKIINFRDQNIQGFDSDLRYSKLVSEIDSANAAIASNTTNIRFKYSITPTLGTKHKQTINLTNAISKGDLLNNVTAITSTNFYYANLLVNLGDDGKGNLVLYRASAKTKTPIITVGRVDYDSGTLYIDTLLVDRIPLDQNYISIIVTPKYNDVIAYKNQILLLDDADIKVSAVNLDYVRLS